MPDLKDALLVELQKIKGIEARPSPVAGGTALFYRGKSIAHFHNDNELDLRLTKKLIRAQGLSHPEGSFHHPGRSPDSPWIELRLEHPGDVEKLAGLVRLAVAGF